eukprot:RCo005079
MTPGEPTCLNIFLLVALFGVLVLVDVLLRGQRGTDSKQLSTVVVARFPSAVPTVSQELRRNPNPASASCRSATPTVAVAVLSETESVAVAARACASNQTLASDTPSGLWDAPDVSFLLSQGCSNNFAMWVNSRMRRRVVRSDENILRVFSGALLLHPYFIYRKKVFASVVEVLNLNGDVLYCRQFVGRLWAPKFISSTAVSILGTRDSDEVHSSGLVWDFAKNTLTTTSLGPTLNDVDFDPLTQSWIALQVTKIPVRCVEPTEEVLWDGDVLHARCDPLPASANATRFAVVHVVRELSVGGHVLWWWNPLSYLFPTPEEVPGPDPTSRRGAGLKSPRFPRWCARGSTCMDGVANSEPGDDWSLTRMSTVQIIPAENAVLVTSRALGSVFQIRRSSGEVAWVAGRFGHEMLMPDRGPRDGRSALARVTAGFVTPLPCDAALASSGMRGEFVRIASPAPASAPAPTMAPTSPAER